MRQALLILSRLTLMVIAAVNIGNALIYTHGITYNPATLTTVATIMSGAGGVLSMPLTLATFILGPILTIQQRQDLWSVAIGVVGALAFIGLLGMAWAILSARTPISFCAPLALVPGATFAYCLLGSRSAAALASAA
jgi:hypothetical protein